MKIVNCPFLTACILTYFVFATSSGQSPVTNGAPIVPLEAIEQPIQLPTLPPLPKAPEKTVPPKEKKPEIAASKDADKETPKETDKTKESVKKDEKKEEKKEEKKSEKKEDPDKKEDAKKDKKDEKKEEPKKPEPPKEKKWYDKLSIRGYTQFRTAETIHQRDGSAAATLVGDRSAGDFQNFSIRRARLILFGDISENLFVYLQPDFAITPTGSPDQTFFPQIRDWYGDVYLTKDKVHRLRVGQSKIPFGWENMQSSQNRLTFDRTDAINSAVSRNERDLGVFYYWTPEHYQQLFKRLVDDGLKGSGNYGLFGIGVYNGQGGSFLEQNNNLHAVVRGTYPIEFDNGQILELGVQAYTGKTVVLSSPIRPLGVGSAFRPANTLETGNRSGQIDQRIGGTAVWYPQPFGLQAEWNVGRGPGLTNDQRAVVTRHLDGGYVMGMYKHDTPCWGNFIPYVQWTHYRGGYRSERNAPYVRINEWHIGCEWQIQKALEFTVQYTLTDRTNTTAIDQPGAVSYRQFEGGLLRFQLQINY
jgi:hypothetical protein